MQSRTAVLTAFGEPLDIREYPVPDPEPGAIVVKVRLTSICGSDLHLWRGEGGRVPLPPSGRVMGHEMVGEVAALGAGVQKDSLGHSLKEGDRIIFPFFHPCRQCWACSSGRFSLCPNRTQYYLPADTWPHLHGGFADYYYLHPGHFVFKVPDELPDEMVSSVNCALSQVTHALQQADFGFGDSLVIQGAGGLGLYATAVARDMGASKIMVIDGLANRLELAKRFGADEVISIRELDSPEARVQRVKDLTDGRGARVVLEVVGQPQVIQEGLQMVQSGGTYLEVGLITAKFSIELFPSRLVGNNTRYVAVNHYEPIILSQALQFLQRNRTRFPFDKMISHRFPLEQINEAFARAEWSGRAPEQATVTRAAIAPGG